MIANAINPKGKGWAWRKGKPIAFDDPSQTTALIGWASRQPWFMQAAVGDGWIDGRPGITWHQVYLDMCLEMAESRYSRPQFGFVVRNMVAAAIKTAVK